MIPGALLLALACAACNRPPPPPPEQPPEPQASTQLGDAIQAPIERAKAVEGAVQDAAEKQKAAIDAAAGRSEEHTSELQSLMRIPFAVFCLKKKTRHNS